MVKKLASSALQSASRRPKVTKCRASEVETRRSQTFRRFSRDTQGERGGGGRQMDSETENEEVAVSGRRALTPTNYDSRRCYVPFVPPRKRSRLGVVSKGTGKNHNGEKPTPPIEVVAQRAREGGRGPSGGKGGDGALSGRIRAALAARRSGGSSSRLTSAARSPRRAPRGGYTDRLPPRGNYERRDRGRGRGRSLRRGE